MISEEIRKLRPSHGLKDYIAVISRRRWIIIVSFISVLLSTFYYVQYIEDIFESYSTLVIEENNNLYSNQIITNKHRSLSYYEGILNSRSFLENVIDSIGIEEFTLVYPRFTKKDALKFIQSNLSLKKTTFTSFLHLTARARSSNLSFRIADVATAVFRNQCKKVESEESRRAVVEIDKQLQIIRKNLEQAEHDYRSFSEISGQIDEGSTPELKTLQKAYSNELAQIGLKKADLDAEKKQLSKLESSITPSGNQKSPEYVQFRAKLSELEKERLRLEKLGIRLGGISTLDREIREIENRLLDFKQTSKTVTDPATIHQWQDLRKSVIAKEAELQLSSSRLASYQKAINLYKEGNPDILSKSLELLRLKRSKEVYENLYMILLERAEEGRIRSASLSAGIKIVDFPIMPQSPIPKNENRFYLAGIILGLILGLGLAFLIEFNDTTIKSNDDIEKYVGLSVLGTIPHINLNKKDDNSIKINNKAAISLYHRPLFNFEGDDSIITESYRSLRTNISFVSPDKPLKTIALTSACPSEGKSITIANLAMAYAQMGKRILLIDTDLRRPVLHHIFNKKREPGFTDLFIENPDYNSIIKPTESKFLSIITAGIFTPNPAEIIGSNKMIHLMEYFKNHFDIVFFDTPPIIAVTDATLLGSKVDGLLLVIRSRHTDRELTVRSVNALKRVGVHVVGTILNDINLSHQYSSYGYYKYYYHYYKSKND